MRQQSRVIESASKQHYFHWDDLRYCLALFRHKKLVSAGKSLKVDHTTVSRRVRELESALNTKLFEKTDLGFEATDSGKHLIFHAESIEGSMITLQEKIHGNNNVIKGLVRINAPDSFANYVLAPKLPALNQQHTRIDVELMTAHDDSAFARRDADILITQKKATNGRYVAKRLLKVGLSLYGSCSYLQQHPAIKTMNDLVTHDYIGYVNSDVHLVKLDGKEVDNYFRKTSLRTCNIMAQIQAVKHNYGLSVLPHYVAKNDPDLIRALPDECQWNRDYWLLMHEDMRDVPRIRKAYDFISDIVSKSDSHIH